MKKTTVFLLLVFLAGCAGSGGTTGPSDETVGPAEDSVATETIDITPYSDPPADVRVEIEHDVPEALLENRADAGISVTIDGFRVQVFSTLDQAEAAMNQEAAQQYWSRLVEEGAIDDDLPVEPEVYRLFRQPYYRIRVGDFADRVTAERVAAIFARRFDGAFVVPDEVTIRK